MSSAVLADEGVLEGGDGPATALLGDDGGDPRVVDSPQRTVRRVQRRGGDGDDATGCDDAGDVELEANGAPGVDRVEDRLVTIADRGTVTAVVGAADVDEVGVVGEGCSEGGTIGAVPRSLQLLELRGGDGGTNVKSGPRPMPDTPPSLRERQAQLTREEILNAAGAAAEPDLEIALSDGQRRHVEGAGRIVRMLQGLDALDESVDPEAAVDTLAAISDVRFALVLRESYGWSLDRIETWIAATSRALLLRSP